MAQQTLLVRRTVENTKGVFCSAQMLLKEAAVLCHLVHT